MNRVRSKKNHQKRNYNSDGKCFLFRHVHTYSYIKYSNRTKGIRTTISNQVAGCTLSNRFLVQLVCLGLLSIGLFCLLENACFFFFSFSFLCVPCVAQIQLPFSAFDSFFFCLVGAFYRRKKERGEKQINLFCPSIHPSNSPAKGEGRTIVFSFILIICMQIWINKEKRERWESAWNVNNQMVKRRVDLLPVEQKERKYKKANKHWISIVLLSDESFQLI